MAMSYIQTLANLKTLFKYELALVRNLPFHILLVLVVEILIKLNKFIPLLLFVFVHKSTLYFELN